MATNFTDPDHEPRAVSSITTDDDEGVPAKPIVRPPTRAKSTARQNLVETLAAKYRHDEASATALARAVVDPTQTRLALKSPISERVPGGTLHIVHVDVWPPAVTPSPINPRAAGERIFPAGTSADPRRRGFRRPLVAAGSDAHGAPVLTVEVEDQDHLIDSLQSAMEVLMSTAEKLIVDLPLQGVMRPITLAPMRIGHGNGSPDLTIATSPDGSSRTTIAWRHWGIDSAGEVYRADDRRLGQRIARAGDLADKDAALLTDDERALLRLNTIPAEVIVGYTPDPGSTVSFAEAIDAWVAAIHIDPPRKWGTSADLDTKATAILGSFAQQAAWSAEYLDYLAGMLTPPEAVEAGFRPEADARAVEILAVLGDEDHKRILNDGLRRLIGGSRRPRRPDRIEPLVELMLRPMRGSATPTEIGVMRTILLNLRDMAEWNRQGWQPSALGLDDLHAAAVKELEDATRAQEDYEDAGSVGPYVEELAYMAVFWLARHGGLRRQTHRGEGHDDREPQHLLRELMASPYGLDILRHVLEDGRAGLSPRAIRPDGTVVTNATGAEVAVTTDWLREAFPVKGSSHPGPNRPTYDQVVIALRGAIYEVEAAVKRLTSMKGSGGEPLTQALGIKPSVVEDDMLPKLNWASRELDYCARMWQERHDANHGFGDDEDLGEREEGEK